MNKKRILKTAKAISGRSRKPMPRPTVFEDKTKYKRAREKQKAMRYE